MADARMSDDLASFLYFSLSLSLISFFHSFILVYFPFQIAKFNRRQNAKQVVLTEDDDKDFY